MKKLFSVLSFTFLFIHFSFAQNKIDSLRRVIQQSGEDTVKVLSLIRLSGMYLYSKPDTGLLFVVQAHQLAKKLNYQYGIAASLLDKGNFLVVTGNYPNALRVYLEALKISEKLHDSLSLSHIYMNIGSVYSLANDERKSLVYSSKAEKIVLALKNENILSTIWNNIGDSYERLHQLDSALYYTERSYAYAQMNYKPGRTGVKLLNLGSIHSKLNHPDLALSYYRLSIEDLGRVQNFQGISDVNLKIAELYDEKGRADSALYYGRLSFDLADKGGFPSELADAAEFLKTYFKEIHRYDSAFHYQEVMVAAKDSLFSAEKMKSVQNLSLNEQLRQSEIEQARVEAADERKQNIQLAGITAFIPVFFSLVLLSSKRRIKPGTVRFLGILGLLLLFEFITILTHPYVARVTHHSPVWMLLIMVAIASVLVPLHHRMEHWIRERLAHKK